MKTYINPYRAGSSSVRALRDNLDARVIRTRNSRFKGAAGKTVINWGATEVSPEVSKCRVLNAPDVVRRASNKRMFFEACQQAPETQRPSIPYFTSNREEARDWLGEAENRQLFARTVLAGHSGEGIVRVTTMEQLDALPANTLLVGYKRKRREFRIHVSQTDGVFSIQEKLLSGDYQPPEGQEIDWQVRNHENGFIYARQDIALPVDGEVLENAVKALAVTGLDFGAVDVIWNQRENQSYVLEVNTAPGLEGSTVADYARMFNSISGGGAGWA